MEQKMKEELLFVRHLHVEFQHGGQKEEAVRDVSFDVGCGLMNSFGSGEENPRLRWCFRIRLPI